jgi:eukaryotic-like serine/threonine-protein kinase
MFFNKRVFASLLTVVLASGLAIAFAQDQPQTTAAAITQFRGSTLRTGVYDSPALTAEPTLLWQFPMPRPVRMTPAVHDGVVYIGGEDGRLHALNADTGEQLWRFDVGDSVVSSPAVTDDTLYLGSLDNNFYALDSATGQLRWQFETDGQIYSSPALIDEALYFGSRDRRLYALSLDGDLLWQAETEGEVWSSPAVSSGLVIVGDTDGKLSAFDQQSGGSVWAVDVGSTRATPAILGDVVFIGGGANQFSAISLNSGAILATTQIGSGGLEASAAVTADGIYMIAMDGTLTRLDYEPQRQTFSTAWSVNIGGPAYSSPSYADGVVYVVTEASGLLYAFEGETGEKLWQFVTGTQGDWRSSSPVLIDDILYVASNTQGMLALHNP